MKESHRATVFPPKARVIIPPDMSMMFTRGKHGLYDKNRMLMTTGSLTRAGLATGLWNGVRHTVTSGRARYEANNDDNGILLEGLRNNYYDGDPTNPDDRLITLPLGTFTLWLEGSDGTALIDLSGGATALGSGWGTATEGSPVTVTITTAGTVSIDVALTITHIQVEQGNNASSAITVGGATRTIDNFIFNKSYFLDMATQGSMFAEVVIKSLRAADQYLISWFTTLGFIGIKSGTGELAFNDGGVEKLSGLFYVPSDEKQIIGLTYSGTTANMYLNGAESASMAFDGDMNINLNVQLGSDLGSSKSLFGNVSQMDLYKRRVSSADAKILSQELSA